MNSSSNTINVIYAFDDKYLAPAMTSINSLLQNNATDSLHITILDTGISDHSSIKNLVEKYKEAKVNFNKIDLSEIKKLPHNNFSTSTWARIYIPDILTEQKRAIYLDSDTIILHSLKELWDLDLGDKMIAACKDYLETSPFKSIKKHKKNLQMSDKYPYFNAGVVLCDLEKLRRFSATNKILGIAKSYQQKLKYPDQDALNILFTPHCHYLDQSWNFQNTFFRKGNNSQKIIHYTAIEKPWYNKSKAPLAQYYNHFSTNISPQEHLKRKHNSYLFCLKHFVKKIFLKAVLSINRGQGTAQ